jgi:hypothetical protein
MFWIEEFARLGRFARPHRIEAPYRQQDNVRFVKLTDVLHVAEQRSIPGMVYSTAIAKSNDKPSGFPAWKDGSIGADI